MSGKISRDDFHGILWIGGFYLFGRRIKHIGSLRHDEEVLSRTVSKRRGLYPLDGVAIVLERGGSVAMGRHALDERAITLIKKVCELPEGEYELQLQPVRNTALPILQTAFSAYCPAERVNVLASWKRLQPKEISRLMTVVNQSEGASGGYPRPHRMW